MQIISQVCLITVRIFLLLSPRLDSHGWADKHQERQHCFSCCILIGEKNTALPISWLFFCLFSVKVKTLRTVRGLFIKIQVHSALMHLTHTYTHTHTYAHNLSSMTRSSEVDEELPSFCLSGSQTKEVRVLGEELVAPSETQYHPPGRTQAHTHTLSYTDTYLESEQHTYTQTSRAAVIHLVVTNCLQESNAAD